jgi:hypothetical protein
MFKKKKKKRTSSVHIYNHLLNLRRTLASKLLSSTQALLGVKISPAQEKSLSTLAELGRAAFDIMNNSFTLGKASRELRVLLLSARYAVSSSGAEDSVGNAPTDPQS